MPNHMYTGADVPQWLQDAFNNCEKVENAQTDVLKPLDVQIGGDHYKKYAIQPATYNMTNNIPWAEGDVISYVTRWRDKGGVEDLRKAIHILEMLIEFEEGK